MNFFRDCGSLGESVLLTIHYSRFTPLGTDAARIFVERGGRDADGAVLATVVFLWLELGAKRVVQAVDHVE